LSRCYLVLKRGELQWAWWVGRQRTQTGSLRHMGLCCSLPARLKMRKGNSIEHWILSREHLLLGRQADCKSAIRQTESLRYVGRGRWWVATRRQGNDIEDWILSRCYLVLKRGELQWAWWVGRQRTQTGSLRYMGRCCSFPARLKMRKGNSIEH
jgi:hypothetical protein